LNGPNGQQRLVPRLVRGREFLDYWRAVGRPTVSSSSPLSDKPPAHRLFRQWRFDGDDDSIISRTTARKRRAVFVESPPRTRRAKAAAVCDGTLSSDGDGDGDDDVWRPALTDAPSGRRFSS